MSRHHPHLRAITPFQFFGGRSAQGSRRRGDSARADGVTDEERKREPAYIRECCAGWHVHNGKGELCFTFAKSYDSCRLHGRLLVLCKKFPGGVDVVEYNWDPSAGAFVEYRRYTDEAPFCDDVA